MNFFFGLNKDPLEIADVDFFLPLIRTPLRLPTLIFFGVNKDPLEVADVELFLALNKDPLEAADVDFFWPKQGPPRGRRC